METDIFHLQHIILLRSLKCTVNTCSATAISRVNRAIASDLQSRYQDNELRMLLNKASLLDPRLKSLVYLNEEEQTNTIDNLVNEIVTTFSQYTPDMKL